MKALLVEDQKDLREVLAQMLELATSLSVVVCANAEEALQVLPEHNVDIVLTDIIMPGAINGIELARIIKQKRPGAKIICMTGNAFDMEEAAKKICDRFLEKPVDIQDLLQAFAAFGVELRKGFG